MDAIMKKPAAETDSATEVQSETILLERLQSAKGEEDYFRWLLLVVGFYRGIKRLEAAKALIEDYIRTGENPQRTVQCYLALGQIETDEQKYENALVHFLAALNLGPNEKRIVYVLHNNAAYCLNLLGRYADGERHCRAAIEIDAARASAYRNLGISLNGQGNILGAAWTLAEAVRADAADDRAHALLQKVVAQDATMVLRCPWLNFGLYPSGEAAQEFPQS